MKKQGEYIYVALPEELRVFGCEEFSGEVMPTVSILYPKHKNKTIIRLLRVMDRKGADPKIAFMEDENEERVDIRLIFPVPLLLNEAVDILRFPNSWGSGGQMVVTLQACVELIKDEFVDFFRWCEIAGYARIAIDSRCVDQTFRTLWERELPIEELRFG